MNKISTIISEMKRLYHDKDDLAVVLKDFGDSRWEDGWADCQKLNIKIERKKKMKHEKKKNEFLDKAIDYSDMVDNKNKK